MTAPSSQTKSQQVRLISKNDPERTSDQFETETVHLPPLGSGEILVRNEWMLLSVVNVKLVREGDDPDVPMPPYRIGEVPWALTVGTVVESRSDNVSEGVLVSHTSGWREFAVLDESACGQLDRSLLPSSEHFLTQGPTAYRGMEILEVGDGDVVYVSGASGAVGSLAGQIARCRGAKQIIGSAGSDDKVSYLVDELGFTDGFNYRDGDPLQHLQRVAPDGISCFFDNVGGEQLRAAIDAAQPNARVALCGWQSGDKPVLDLAKVIGRDIRIRGFTSSYDPGHIHKWYVEFGKWLSEGNVVFPRTVVHGVSMAPEAIQWLIDGKVKGQLLVGLQDL